MYLTLVWGLLLLLPNLVYFTVADAPWDALLRTLPPSLAFLVGLICWTRSPGLVLILLSPFYFLLPFETYYIIKYGHPSSSHILAVVSESNPMEAIEYIGLGHILLGLVLGLALMATTLWFAFQAPRLPTSRIVRMLALASLIPLLQYTWLEWHWNTSDYVFDAHAEQASMEKLLTTESFTPVGEMLCDSYPLGVYFRLSDYISERDRLREVGAAIREHDFHAQRSVDTQAPETYVLVIGESARPDHLALNGYARDTTPQLEQLDHLASFRNVVSPWSATRLAVPVILTHRQTAAHTSPLGLASIVTLFKQAGFQTYWISNQAPLGPHDSIIAVHAYEANKTIYTNATDYKSRGAFDDAILPVFERFLAEPYNKKFFIIHMMGSHKKYANRYPKAFDRFKPSQLSNPELDNIETVINSYDNSILFSDHVLASLIRSLKAQQSISAMFFISDHGENLPTNTCDATGHGYDNEADFRVASLLWLSDSYVSYFPEIWNRANHRRDAPFHSTGVFHTLADLAHITHPEHDATKSWISDTWKKAPRWTNAVPDFDAALKDMPCQKLKMP